MKNAKVIFSSDRTATYFFCLPLTSIIWKKYIGFDPVCFLAGSEGEWLSDPLTQFVLDKTKESGAEIHFLGHVDQIGDGTLCQVSRAYGGCLEVEDDEYILTSDADMWPLNRQWFRQGANDKLLHLFYANAYGHEKYPMCYVGAAAKQWRDIMSVQRGDSLNGKLSEQLKTDLNSNSKFFECWNYDELLLGKKIKSWHNYPDGCHMIERGPTNDGPPVGRIDRYNWSFTSLTDVHIDAHLLRMVWQNENWSRTVGLLECLLDKTDFDWAISYRDKFTSYDIDTKTCIELVEKLK